MEKLQTISHDSFALLCFLVLMQGGDGFMGKSSSYITEKTRMMNLGLDAFGYLDINNMRKVNEWCSVWGVEMPEKCAEELKRQGDAEKELIEKGFIF